MDSNIDDLRRRVEHLEEQVTRLIASKAAVEKALEMMNLRLGAERRTVLELFNFLSHHFPPHVQKVLREALENWCLIAPEAFDLKIPPDDRLSG